MGSISDNLKKCGVKISALIGGVPSVGSGVVYETPNYCNYNYIITAKHIFQEDSLTSFQFENISTIDIFYPEVGKFKKLQHIKKSELRERLLVFEEDLAIVIIDKNDTINFHQIMVADTIQDEDNHFFSWATFSANESQLHLFHFERNDNELKRIKLKDPPSHESLRGMSGAGVFIKDRHILYGIVCRYPNDNFENNTIDCTPITFDEVNTKLISLQRITLDRTASSHKREIKKMVVDIHQVTINGVCLDLELARRRLKTDLIDDWFHDPLKYIDLLNQDYLFKQFEDYFNEYKYRATKSEQFYVPKKKLTLRQALVSPFVDRIMYIAVVGVLAEKMDMAMISSVYSARYNKFSKNQLILNGVEQWKKMKYILEKRAYEKDALGNFKYGCIIEIDLLNYYDNINKKLLIEKIKRICETENEKQACRLLGEMLLFVSDKELGLPQNSDASSLLASFYLNQVDIFMHNNTFGYYRFMDDIRILCKDKYEGRKILQQFEFELRRCDLSVNSQKTEIKSIVDQATDSENFILREELKATFDLELSKISRLRESENYAYLNEAFHQSIELLKNNIDEDLNGSEEMAKKLNYALNTIELLGKKSIHLYNDDVKFLDNLLLVTKSLIDKPWLTTQICKVLNLVGRDKINCKFWDILCSIVLDERFNTYSFQTYQIWLLLAKHKHRSEELIKFAVRGIEKNDETNRVVIAAMVIYVCSVEKDYKRVILRKFGQGFAHKYFQNRLALIALRSFNTELISMENIDPTLKNAPEFTNVFKNKELVYIQGSDEGDEEEDEIIEQLYSL